MIKLLTILLALTMFQIGCSDAKGTRRLLEREGYTNITITGWKPLDAGDKDVFSTGFMAKNTQNKYVKGVVTKRLWGSKTIRFKD